MCACVELALMVLLIQGLATPDEFLAVFEIAKYYLSLVIDDAKTDGN